MSKMRERECQRSGRHYRIEEKAWDHVVAASQLVDMDILAAGLYPHGDHQAAEGEKVCQQNTYPGRVSELRQ